MAPPLRRPSKPITKSIGVPSPPHRRQKVTLGNNRNAGCRRISLGGDVKDTIDCSDSGATFDINENDLNTREITVTATVVPQRDASSGTGKSSFVPQYKVQPPTDVYTTGSGSTCTVHWTKQGHAQTILMYPVAQADRLHAAISQQDAEHLLSHYDELECDTFTERNSSLEETHFKQQLKLGAPETVRVAPSTNPSAPKTTTKGTGTFVVVFLF